MTGRQSVVMTGCYGTFDGRSRKAFELSRHVPLSLIPVPDGYSRDACSTPRPPMPHPNPRILIPIAIIAAVGVGGYYLDRQRAERRSTLSGFFESQPTQVA